ncbi:acyltransferase [Gordonia sp. VNK21]|uniref:acyltransferase n=1 Tax=Gordonia sp. VNK21 TaxID=3382483 RepID=UPI0038D4E17E
MDSSGTRVPGAPGTGDAAADSAPNATTPAHAAPTASGDGAVAPESTPAGPAPKKKDRHLYQIDFVRLVTFAGVVLDHVILSIASSTEIVAQGIGLILRYTRYCFFALTGFVLTYQYRNRELHAPTFWRRRFKLIGLPFLTWSLFYWVYNRYRRGGLDELQSIVDSTESIRLAVKSIAYDLITGHAAYHLYFLSVSMQIYVVFPAVLWVLKRTWGYHRYLLLVSGTFHIWLLYHMVRPPLQIFSDGFLGVIWRYLGITLLPYQFFILAGCLAAYHFEGFGAFMKRYKWPLALGSLVAIIVTLVYYRSEMHAGEETFRATNVFMVHNAFAYIGIIVLLYLGGTLWQNRRTPGSIADTLMRKAADRSFAIYLAHVLAIFSIMPLVNHWAAANGWRILITYLIVCVMTVFLVEVLRLSPVSLITTGRNRLDWREQNPLRQLPIAAGSIALGLILWYGDWASSKSLGQFFLGTGLLLAIGAGAVLYRRRTDRDETPAAV